MEKGGIAMKVDKKWSASSKSKEIVRDEELVSMSGQWGVGIEISITKPYSYSKGPIEKRVISNEIHKKELHST